MLVVIHFFTFFLFIDVGPLFDNEWMTSKIDLTCLPEQLDSNFNLVGVSDEIQSGTLSSVGAEIQSPAIVTALLGDRSVNIEKVDETDPVPVSIDESILEEYVPTSPEQHVPDVDAGIGERFKILLDSCLAANGTSVQEHSLFKDHTENDVSIVEPTCAQTKVALKRKMSDAAPQGPKPKVKTPEQKQRKKLQNRNAATKYRSKKRGEQEILNAKCLELEDENAELQQKVETKRQEIQYLKNLIIDVFSKKRAGT
jgi:hypothetical protein